MAATHTKTGTCLWPAHIVPFVGPTALTSGFRVYCQNTGPILQDPATVPAVQTFLIRSQAQTAADAWLSTVGAV